MQEDLETERQSRLKAEKLKRDIGEVFVFSIFFIVYLIFNLEMFKFLFISMMKRYNFYSCLIIFSTTKIRFSFNIVFTALLFRYTCDKGALMPLHPTMEDIKLCLSVLML